MQEKVGVRQIVNAKKEKLGEQEALALLEGVSELYATKGKAVVHLDLRKARPKQAELLALLLGPSGSLRAPVLRVGRKLVVGFDEATYRALFG